MCGRTEPQVECATDDDGGQSRPLLECVIEGETKSTPNLVKQCKEETNKLNKGDGAWNA